MVTHWMITNVGLNNLLNTTFSNTGWRAVNILNKQRYFVFNSC